MFLGRELLLSPRMKDKSVVSKDQSVAPKELSVPVKGKSETPAPVAKQFHIYVSNIPASSTKKDLRKGLIIIIISLNICESDSCSLLQSLKSLVRSKICTSHLPRLGRSSGHVRCFSKTLRNPKDASRFSFFFFFFFSLNILVS